MALTQKPIALIGLVVIGASFALAASACSSSTSGTGSSSGATSGGTSGTSGTSGGTSGTSGGTSGTSGSTGGPKNCATSSSSCTQAEIQPYTDCVSTKCDSALTQCYGSGYKTGNYSGACGTYITCTQACACGDNACVQKCTPDMACLTCIQSSGVGTCSQSCTLPACATTGSSGSSGTSGTSGSTGKTCTDFQTCCNAKADANAQASCLQVYDAIKGSGDAACNAAYSSYCP